MREWLREWWVRKPPGRHRKQRRASVVQREFKPPLVVLYDPHAEITTELELPPFRVSGPH